MSRIYGNIVTDYRKLKLDINKMNMKAPFDI